MFKWLGFLGILGAVVALFGFIGAMASNSFTLPLVLFHLGLGFILIVVWIISGAAKVENFSNLMTGRQSRFVANVVSYTLVFFGILIVINYFVSRVDRRLDLTEAGAYSLSKQSGAVISGLKQPLKIVGVADGVTADPAPLKDLFALYQFYNPSLVTTEIINPRAKPQVLEAYGMNPGNVIYIEFGKGESKAVSRINEVTEEAITNAIIKLTRGAAKKIYYVQGHDELGLESSEPAGLKLLADSISDEHLTVAGILLSRSAAIPDDAAAVMLVGPKKALLPEEKEMLIKYGDGGGRLVLMTDPRTTEDVRDIAKHFGIEVGNDVVIDQIQRLFAAPTLGAQPMVVDYGSHVITKNFDKQTPTVFNVASSVRPAGTSDGTTTYTELLKSSATAWAESNLTGVFESEEPTAVLDQNDLQGPFSLVAAAEKKIASPAKSDSSAAEPTDAKFEKISRVVVFGDSDWVMNQNLNVYANRDLILNTINWVVGEEGGVSIRPKSMRASFAPIPRDTFALLITASFVIPELILIFGMLVWWRRKALLA